MARECRKRRDERRVAALGGAGRLADAILTDKIHLGIPSWADPAKYTRERVLENSRWLKQDLATRKFLAIDNVSRHFYEHPRVAWRWRDHFPNARPPFQRCWMESAAPAWIQLADGWQKPGFSFPLRWGVLINSGENVRPEDLPANLDLLREMIDEVRPPLLIEYTAITTGRSIQSPGEEVLDMFMPSWFVPCDLAGNTLANPVIVSLSDSVAKDGVSSDTTSEAIHLMTQFVQVAALACSICNCRNVQLAEEPTDRRRDRLRRNQGLRPLLRYSTITIEAVQRAAAGRVGADEDAEPLRRAQHDVRGHLARYTEERPLFGRTGLHGQFWIPEHVRGSREVGRVEGSYRVNPAAGEQPTEEP